MRPVFRDDHNLFRDQVQRFVEREIVPHLAQWEDDGIVPTALWRKAGAEGLLCVSVPQEYGGAGGDYGHSAVLIEELARANATAVGFTTHSEIVANYILTYGSEEQKQRWLPPMTRGELIAVIAMSEPNTGSDLRSMRTRAHRDGDEYVISGQKTFITNGGNAGLAVTAVKLNPAAKELTLIGVEADRDDVPDAGHGGRPVSGTVRDAPDDPGRPPRGTARPGQDSHRRHAQPGQRGPGQNAGGRELAAPLVYGPGDDILFARKQLGTRQVAECLLRHHRRRQDVPDHRGLLPVAGRTCRVCQSSVRAVPHHGTLGTALAPGRDTPGAYQDAGRPRDGARAERVQPRDCSSRTPGDRNPAAVRK